MKCQKCNRDFLEKEIQVSHDVPKYLFLDKNEADKWGRHNLCIKCHDIYERVLFGVLVKSLPLVVRDKLKEVALSFSKSYFGGSK